MSKPKVERIRCDQCEAVMINGLFCHETGCPNSKCEWIDGQWTEMRKCFECRCDVPAEDTCCDSIDGPEFWEDVEA